MYHVILYYKFAPVERLEIFRRIHHRECRNWDLKGRVYVAAEGINGTLAGTPENIQMYMDFLRSQEGFESTEFKLDECEYVPFEKLIVRIRPEIVAIHDPTIDVNNGGTYLEPDAWRRVLESNEDYYLIDTRNDYESVIGHFEGAIKPPIKNFYEFPQWVEEANLDKKKKVLMYCTGGIRCEKFSAFMKDKGFEDVNQLHGGILKYAKEQSGAHFHGKCFVFDDRMAVDVNPENSDPISKCTLTGVPCDQYINCANMDCNKLFICSEQGIEMYQGCCSPECMESNNIRPLDRDNKYRPFRRWYKYWTDKKSKTLLQSSDGNDLN